MHQMTALIPALKSNWLMMHVTVMLLSYAALFAGCLLSIFFLFLKWVQNVNLNFFEALSQDINNQYYNSLFTLVEVSRKLEDEYLPASSNKKLDLIGNFDNISYRLVGIGFAFLTIGILSGAVWANEAWGSYWSWDPKETWALITWIVFAIYLHVRLVRGWSGEKPAQIAGFGFIVLWICYLGVNLLGKGLHSYGWFL